MSNIIKAFRLKKQKTSMERWAIHIIDTLDTGEIRELIAVLTEIVGDDDAK